MTLRPLLLPSLLCCGWLLAATPTRVYHESIGMIQDTTILFSSDFTDSCPLAGATEMRASLPRATEMAPLEAFSILWNIDPSGNDYYRATLRPYNNMPDDVFDRREIIITIDHHTSASDSIIYENHYRKGFGLERNENVLGVEIDYITGRATVYGGDAIPAQLAEIVIPTPLYPITGIQAEGKVKVEYAVTEMTADPMASLATPHTKSSLEERLHDAVPPEGFYRYLDSQSDRLYSLPGGTYTLALLKTISGYDLIYIDGASKNRTLWHEGMKKGELSPTIFSNHYDLKWYDASGRPLQEECSADIEQGAILTLNFPLLHTSVRYSRLPSDK